MILLILFAMNVDVGTQVAAGTPQKTTRSRRKGASSNILPEMFQPLMMITPLVDEACI